MMLDDRAASTEPSQIIADLRRERDEALAREAAIAEVLQVINSSPGDLAPVFQTILEKAVRLCEATHGTLRTFNGETFHLVATAQRKALVLPDAGRGPSSLYRRFSDGEQIIHLADVLGSPEYQLNPGVRAGMDAVQARSWLGVSLRKEARLLGVIAILRQELRPFSDEQLALLQSFAAQAVIVMENARLVSETREALEQQTATAEVLRVINSSPGDLAPVFNAILDKAHALCGAASGGLMLIEGNRYRAVAVHGDPNLAEYWLDLGWIPFPTGDDTLFGRLSRGELVHLRDATTDDGTPKSAQYHRLVELAGARSLVMVPLRKDNVLFGTITAFRKEVQPFSDKQIALLQNFAAQAVIAMENARLLTELQQRTRDLEESLKYQTATSDVLRVISRSTFDLQPVLDTLVATAARLCSADLGLVSSREEDGLRVNATFSTTPEYEAFIRGHLLPLTRGSLAGRACAEGKAVQIPDLTADPEFTITETVTLGKMRAALAVPLMREGEVIGAISLARQRVEPFTERQLELVATFADQAVIAIENTRLITETREALEQQTAMAEVLQVINSSPGDLTPVFDAVLEKALTLCDASFGSVSIGEHFERAVSRGLPAEYLAAVPSVAGPFSPGSLWDRIVGGESVISIPDLAEPEAICLATRFEPLVRLAGARSFIAVALRKDEQLLGLIAIFRREVRPFTDKQIGLMQNFAAQAVIAVENARLLGELRDRTGDLEEALGYQTATSDVLKVISRSAFDLQPVLTTLVETAARLCEADRGLITTQDGEVYRVVATFAVTPEFDAYLRSLTIVPDRGTMTGRIVLERQVVHIDDIARDPEYAVPVSDFTQGAHTILGVPLMREGQPIGAIVLARHRVEPFTPRQIELVRTFSDQAVIAIENARLLTETREALEQQTATAEVLQVINSSLGDRAPVFEAILEKARILCGAAHGSLSLNDGEKFHFVAINTRSQELADWARQGFSLSDFPHLKPLLDGARLVHVPDLAEVGNRFGARTGLFVPLRKDDALLGIISTVRLEIRPFSDKEIALVENFAAQAVIAMENARLLTETREALEQQTATADVLQVINASPGNLAPVFEAMLDKALRLCEAAYGVLNVFDGEHMRTVSARGEARIVDWLMGGGPRRPGPGTTMDRIVRGEHVVQIADVTDDAAYRDGNPTRRALVEIGGCRTMVSIALRKDERLLGAITVYRQQVRPFTDKQIALLENFAAQAVIAMENARLLGELRQRTDEVAELNRGLEARVAEQVDELGRVGRLKRFLAPQLAEMIVSHGDENILESHRREIVVVFCDLRGYTAFTETAEPEEVLDFLREYHGALGPLVSQFEGTLDQFSGDGIMVFFNDPVPCPDPAERAVKMAIAMREAAGTLTTAWRRRGRVLGFGAGIAQGYATLGQIGFADRSGYTAIGTVCNLAARLCAEAKDGQILVGQRVAVAVEETIPLEELGELALKGLTQPVVAFNVPALVAEAAAASPAGTA